MTVLCVANLHGLACFPLLTVMSLFPADQPLSRTWSMVTQMAWETAKVSRLSSLLSFLLSSTPPPPTPRHHHHHLSSLLTCLPLLSCLCFLLSYCHLFLPRLFHPHDPLFQPLPSICSFRLLSSSVLPPLFLWSSGPLVNRFWRPIGQKLGSLLKIATITQYKHSSDTQGRDFPCEQSHNNNSNKAQDSQPS